MTAKRTQGWAGWGIAGLAAVAVAAGLALAGGPMQARKERRDDARLADLQRLASHISCLVGDSDVRQVPGDLAATLGCPGPVPLIDSRTDTHYRIEPLDDGKYRLCADFELPPDLHYRWNTGRRDGDCIVERLPHSGQSEPAAEDPTAVP